MSTQKPARVFGRSEGRSNRAKLAPNRAPTTKPAKPAKVYRLKQSVPAIPQAHLQLHATQDGDNNNNNNDQAENISVGCERTREEAEEAKEKKEEDELHMGPVLPHPMEGSLLSLGELVALVTQEIERSKGRIDTEVVSDLVNRYDYQLNDWKRFAFWDETRGYTRNLVATDNETWTLMVLCWNAQRFSPIHNHAESECFLKCLQGRFMERQYQVSKHPSEPLQLLRETVLNPGESSRINDGIAVHSVGNDGDIPGATLHLYIPPYQQSKCFMDLNKSEGIETRISFYTEGGRLPEDEVCSRRSVNS